MSMREIWVRDCGALAAGHADEIGFLPHTIYMPAWKEKRLIVEGEGEDLVAFCLFGKPRPEMKIFQTLVEYGSQREYIGSAMIEGVVARALNADCERLSLHCAVDLEANRFWAAQGFRAINVRRAATLTRRDAIKWEIEFPKGEQLEKMVFERLQKRRAGELAEMFGIKEAMKNRLRKQFRRKFFNGRD